MSIVEQIGPTIAEIDQVGGRLCLDFVNTANRKGASVVDERLLGYEDIVTWGARSGLLDKPCSDFLRLRAGQHQGQAKAGYLAGLRLRDALWQLFVSAPPPEDARLHLNRALGYSGSMPDGLGVAFNNGRYGVAEQNDLQGWVLLPVAFSALELLTSKRLARVKACPDQRCGWLFLDESPNGRRRWCSMATCGNREKARRHYSASKKTP